MAPPLASRRYRLSDGQPWLFAGVVLYLILFAALPLARLVAEAVLPEGRLGLTLLSRVLASGATVTATLHTLEAGIAASLLALCLGTGAALLVGLTDVRRKPALVFLLLMPILIPAQISALSWLELLGPSSPVLKPLGLAPAPGTRNPLYSREGIVLLLGIEHSTIVFLSVRAGLRAMPRDLVEAARASGARPWQVVRDVVLPQLRPAMLAGAALAFVSAIGNFGIPAFLGIPGRYTMLTTLVYQRLSGFGPSVLGEVGALALILAGLAGIGLGVQAFALRKHRTAVSTGEAWQTFSLGRLRLPIETSAWGLLSLITILPLLALVGTSLVQALGLPLTPATATLEHYRYVLTAFPPTQRAFANSALLAAATGLIVVAVSLPLGYGLVRRPTTFTRLLDLLADAPYALPGIVLSIACIMVYLKPLPLVGVGFYGTFWIILFAYLGRFLALGLRPTAAGIRQLDPSLEEAAGMAGATGLRRLVTIVTPLVAPAAFAGGILVFLAAFNELTVSVLLWSARHETLGVIVFNLYDEGNATAAAAVSVLSVAATLLVAGVLALCARWLPPRVLPWQA